MRKGLIAAAIAVFAFAVVGSGALAKSEAAASPAQVAACTNVSLGLNTVLTGAAAFLGQEQLSWTRFAVSKYNARRGRGSRSSPTTRSSTPRRRAPVRSGSCRTRT